MGNKLFKKSFFGYNRKDVNAYFESVSDKFSEESKSKDDELAKLKEKLDAAELQMDKLLIVKEEYEYNKASISKAMIDAENRAALIIEDAKRAAVEEKLQVQNEIEEETAKLRKLRQDVAYLRRSVTALINRFNGDTESFSE